MARRIRLVEYRTVPQAGSRVILPAGEYWLDETRSAPHLRPVMPSDAFPSWVALPSTSVNDWLARRVMVYLDWGSSAFGADDLEDLERSLSASQHEAINGCRED